MTQLVQIDRNSPKPIFRQLEEQILASIQNGSLKPGDRIPSQYELAKACQVSRATVQKAIDRLIMDELLYFQQGKGIYVAPTPRRQHLPLLQSIDQSLRALGHDVRADLLLLEEIEASRYVGENLALPLTTPVFHIKRLQYVNDEPVVLREAYIEAGRFPGVTEGDLRRSALTDVIQDMGVVQLTGASLAIGSRNANWEESRTLNIEAGASLLTIEEIDYDEHDRPVHYSRNKLRSDRFRVIADALSEYKIALEFRSQPGTVNINLT